MEPVPLLLDRIEEGLDHDGSGVVEKHVDRPELHCRTVHGRVDLGGTRDVGPDGDGVTAGLVVDPIGAFLGGREADVHDDDAGALGGKELQLCASHPRHPSQNQGDLTLVTALFGAASTC